MLDHSALLHRVGLRATSQRIAVISILSTGSVHPTAEQVFFEALRLDDTVSQATVYRTLGALEAVGIIRKLSFDDEPARYEMRTGADHDHLVDTDTGALIEMPSDEISLLRNKIAKELGYEIISHHTIIKARRISQT